MKLPILEMAEVSKTFSFVSQNTGGWAYQKVNTLKTVMLKHDVSFCCVQEHMRLEKNLHKIGEHFNDFCTFSLPDRVHKLRNTHKNLFFAHFQLFNKYSFKF